jgi:hypothetical protein
MATAAHYAVPSSKRIGLIRSTLNMMPLIILAGIAGIALYNPTSYNSWNLAVRVVLEGFGLISGYAWYYQPAYWGVGIIAFSIVWFAYFNWQSVRNELFYFLGWFIAWALVNGLVLSVAMVALNVELFSWSWTHWQLSPMFCSGLLFAAKVPRLRRSHTGSITAGGGELDQVLGDQDADC